MQEEVIHPILISSKRETGTQEDLYPIGFVKGTNLHFIGATTGIHPPFAYTFKRRVKVDLPPCPGCLYEKKVK